MNVILAQTRFGGVTPMKWYKRDPAAALEGMAGLTIEERGFYNGIIDAYFARDGHLPDDDWLLARIVGGINPRTVRKLKVALFKKQKLRVNPVDGTLVPNRGEETLQEGRIYSELQRNRARMRWERGEIASKIKASLMPSVAMPLQPHKNLTLSSFFLTAARDKPEVVEQKDPKPRVFTRADVDAAIAKKNQTAGSLASGPDDSPLTRPPNTESGESKQQPTKQAKEEKRLIDAAEYMARVGNK